MIRRKRFVNKKYIVYFPTSDGKWYLSKIMRHKCKNGFLNTYNIYEAKVLDRKELMKVLSMAINHSIDICIEIVN